jgi:predicted nucleic acid-binding protein
VEAQTRGVLARRKFARALTDEDRTIILALITDAAVWVEPALKVNDCRDQKDNKYPELAATAGAEVFISSDDDRLVLDPWHGIRIVRSVEFLGMAQPSARDPGRSLPA